MLTQVASSAQPVRALDLRESGKAEAGRREHCGRCIAAATEVAVFHCHVLCYAVYAVSCYAMLC